jgi:UDP-glucose 4-epimerase
MIKNKNILITGGAGFIGGSIVKQLYQNNNLKVIDVDIDSKELFGFENSSVNYFDVDISNVIEFMSYYRLAELLENINIIIHCAAIAGIDRTRINTVKTLETNILGAYNLLKACLDCRSTIEKIIIFSTSEVFGNSFNTTEMSKVKIGSLQQARWNYALSKLAAEHFAYAFYKEHNLPVVIIRPFNIFGPGQMGEGAIHTFIVNALENKPIVINDDGSQIRAWCYVDDMVDATIKILEYPDWRKYQDHSWIGYDQTTGEINPNIDHIIEIPIIGESFNIGNNKNTITIYNLAKLIIKLLDSKSEILFKEPLEADIELRVPNIQKAKDILGFEAKIELEDGILKTAEYYKGII